MYITANTKSAVFTIQCRKCPEEHVLSSFSFRTTAKWALKQWLANVSLSVLFAAVFFFFSGAELLHQCGSGTTHAFFVTLKIHCTLFYAYRRKERCFAFFFFLELFPWKVKLSLPIRILRFIRDQADQLFQRCQKINVCKHWGTMQPDSLFWFCCKPGDPCPRAPPSAQKHRHHEQQ